MLPGKKYTPEDFLRIAWRRKWLLVLPPIVVAAAVAVWSSTLPDIYQSSTTILVVPQRVPESYVRPTVTTGIAERLQTISQQILSRTRLERIIDEFDLYEEERQTMIMEDIVAQMRVRDIQLDVAARRRRNDDTSSFTVTFQASEPRVAMQVTERLASMFVQENLQDRAVLADSTNQFLQAQLEDARRRLIEHEGRLEEFRRRNAGRLPSQVQSNLHMIQATQIQLQANADATNRDRDRLATLEQSIAETVAVAQTAGPSVPTDPKDPPSAAQQLEAARANLHALELRLTPEHPNVSRAKRLIAELERKAEQEAQRQPVSGAVDVALPREVGNRVAEMRAETEEIRRRLDTRKQDHERLQQLLSSYTSRVETTPALESELTELMRDYSTLQEQYTTLLRKSEESKIAANLERRQIGEQFKIIDAARLPERPISPDRLRMNLMGLLAGLGFGLVLAAFLEYRDTTLKTDNDVTVSLALPVLAVIPMMISDSERRRYTKRRRLAVSSVASLLAVAAVVIWRFDLLKAWVR
jgi:polysaccharide chain length determinant protein (PEP-CTERM system associated)